MSQKSKNSFGHEYQNGLKIIYKKSQKLLIVGKRWAILSSGKEG